MPGRIIYEQEDLRYLKWSHVRNSSGTAGTFLKSESVIGGKKRYYKLSDFNYEAGVVGHECVNEIIVDRLLTILGVEHLEYDLINALIEVDGKEYETFLCGSYDFKKRGESKAALDDYFRVNANENESPYDFCKRNGWEDQIDEMIAVDYIILNRDRHGANIEVLRNSRQKTIRIAPLFDHGLSLMFSCKSEEEAVAYDISKDVRCNNFIGGVSCLENLIFIKGKKDVFRNRLDPSDKGIIFDGIDKILPDIYTEKIWNMIYERFCTYERFCVYEDL